MRLSDKPTLPEVAGNGNNEVEARVVTEASPNMPEETAANVADEPVDSDNGQLPEEPGNSQDANQAPDPFDPESLRLSQDFAAGLGVTRQLLTVPVKKPSRERWVRVHPDEAYRIQTAVLELKDDRETYLVGRPLWADLATESTFSPRALFTTVDRQGVLFLWPIRLPGPDGKIDDWSRSALEAAEMAANRWVRVTANMDAGYYDVFVTEANLPEPEWPDVPFRDLLKIAFKDRFIDTLDHPVLKRLRGEI